MRVGSYEQIKKEIGANRCWYCGCVTVPVDKTSANAGVPLAGNSQTRDHVIPKGLLFSTMPHNIACVFNSHNHIPCCYLCNHTKADISYLKYTESRCWGKENYPDIHARLTDLCNGYEKLLKSKKEIERIQKIYEALPHELMMPDRVQPQSFWDTIVEIVKIVLK